MKDRNKARDRAPIMAVRSMARAVMLAHLCACTPPAAVSDEGERTATGRKAEFPLAIYVANNPDRLAADPRKMRSVLDDLADSPFRVLVNYGGPEGSPENRRRYLDALHERGLREIYSLKDYYAQGVWGAGPFLEGRSEQVAIREDVERLKDHPAILGWYISDEEIDADAVRRHHQWVKQADPSRFTLTLVNMPDPEKLAPFLDAGDVLAIDAYPIGNAGRITDVAAYTDALVSTAKNRLPAWVVIQAYGGYMNRKDFRDIPGATVPLDSMRARGRAPTPREMRAMTFLALTHGAKGIVFYYYKDIQMAFDRESRWEAAKSIGREVLQLSPVLLAEDIDPKYLSADNDLVHWRAKSTSGGATLLTVNGATDTQSVKFRFPADLTDIHVASGAGFAHAEGTDLLLILDGYEAMTVNVTLPDEFDWASHVPVAPVAKAEPRRAPGGGHWRFEEDEGTQVRNALAPAKVPGSLGGAVKRSDFTPPASALPESLPTGRSLDFPGQAGSFLIMDDIDALDVGEQDFTLEAWIHPRNAAKRPVIAGKAISGWFEDRGYALRLLPATAGAEPACHLSFEASYLDPALRSRPLSFGSWRHVAVTRKGRVVRLFVDGRLEDRATLSPPATLHSRQRFSIGCSAKEGEGDPGSPFDGHIDEVRLVIGQALGPEQFLRAGIDP